MRIYSIVDHTLHSGATRIKIVPALAVGTINSSGESIFIHSTGLPTIAASSEFVMNASAATSKEFSLIDQFIGLASFMTLPDTTVDIHKYHVVGLGRQAAVQQTGKVHHTGGSLEMPLHNARWLYYSLGRDVVDWQNCGTDPSDGSTQYQTSQATAITPGQVYVDLASGAFGGVTAAVGDYILIKDTTKAPTTTYKAPNLAIDTYWPVQPSPAGLAQEDEHFEWTETSECRRIAAIETLGSGKTRFYIDDSWAFTHGTCDVYLREPDDNGPTIASDKTITNAVKHLIFSSDTIPSFCVEHSVRNRDMGSYSQESGSAAPNTSTSSNQLTRVFKGCKIVEWEISSTVDAELKYRAIFDALSCYTDTGRLESPAGDRYTAHRMFQNTATDAAGRIRSGIASGSEKPFMFYNGTVKAFGASLGMVTAFELRGKTGVELFHTIQGTSVGESVNADNLSLKQVPYGGTRNASIIREGREEFEMEIDVVLSDATLWHQLRSHIEHSATVGTIGDAAGFIELHFTKPVTGSSGATPSLRIILDDYVITEAPIPVPDDKGLLHSKIRLEPRNVKVMTTDTVYHY